MFSKIVQIYETTLSNAFLVAEMLSWCFFPSLGCFLECSLSGGSVDENAQIVALHPMCGWEVFFSFYKMTLLECSLVMSLQNAQFIALQMKILASHI